jgi:hypothetical protein
MFDVDYVASREARSLCANAQTNEVVARSAHGCHMVSSKLYIN